jgi:hypothetical protein
MLFSYGKSGCFHGVLIQGLIKSGVFTVVCHALNDYIVFAKNGQQYEKNPCGRLTDDNDPFWLGTT